MYWRLSGFYFFYFATLGAFIPYWGLYLKSLGYSAEAIGELVAIIMATKIVAPYLWGWIADHSGRRVLIIRVASLCAMAGFSGVLMDDNYGWLALVMVVFSFFWNAALPQFEATTMTHLEGQEYRYSAIRLWGSIGFIVAVVALGFALDHFGAGIVPPVVLVTLAGIWVASLLVPAEVVERMPQAVTSVSRVLRQPQVITLLVICFLMQFSHGPYYTFFSIYLEAHQYTRTTIGQLWALGVMAEIGVFLVMHRLLPRYGVRNLLLVSLGLAALRWVLTAHFVDHLLVMLAAQLMHAASFGVYHAVAITLIHRFFTGSLQGRGQALYSSLSFGAGGAAGSLVSGYLWEAFGPLWTYQVAALASALACWLAARRLDLR